MNELSDVERCLERLVQLERENQQLRMDIQHIRIQHEQELKECDIDTTAQLRNDLKQCAEVLCSLMTEESVSDHYPNKSIYQYSFQVNSQMHKDINKALSLPSIQTALKKTKET